MIHVGVLSWGTMCRDFLPKCFLLLLLILPKCWAPYDFVTLGDTPGLLKDNNRYLLVSLEGESIDLVCNANAAIYPHKTFQWEKNGKVEKQGNLMIEEHLIMNIDEHMDDLTFTCRYSIYTKNNKGLPSWNEWSVTVELAVFKLTVQATNITCGNGVGDLQLSFKEARKNRNDQATLETKIKSKLEDLSGLSLSYGYSVTVPFEKVINSVTLIAMKPIFIIDGTPTASCPMFKEVPKIDKRCPIPTEVTQKLEPGLNSEDDKAHKKKKHKNNEMKISSITPNEAQADEPVKIIILAENLPQPGEILVVFSTPEWTKEVKPVNQHHHHALEVFTPKLDHKILHKTKVYVKLVRSSNKIETKPVELILLPAMETQQDSPPKQDPKNDQCSTKAAQIGTYVVIVAGAVLGSVLAVCLYKHAMKKKIEKKVCTQSGHNHNHGHSLLNTTTVSTVWSAPKLCPQSGHQDKEDKKQMDWDSVSLDMMMEETCEKESSPILDSKQEEPTEDTIDAAPTQVVVHVHPRPKKNANTENRDMDLVSPTTKRTSSDEPHTKNRERKTSSVPAIKASPDEPQTKNKDLNKSLLQTNQKLRLMTS